MLPQQKEATGTLVVCLMSALLAPVARNALPLWPSESIFGVLLLMILLLWGVRLAAGLKSSSLDERDWLIRYRAGMIGLMVFGALMVLGVFVLYLVHRPTGVLPIHEMVLLLFSGWVVLDLVWAISILMLYRHGSVHG